MKIYQVLHVSLFRIPESLGTRLYIHVCVFSFSDLSVWLCAKLRHLLCINYRVTWASVTLVHFTGLRASIGVTHSYSSRRFYALLTYTYIHVDLYHQCSNSSNRPATILGAFGLSIARYTSGTTPLFSQMRVHLEDTALCTEWRKTFHSHVTNSNEVQKCEVWKQKYESEKKSHLSVSSALLTHDYAS